MANETYSENAPAKHGWGRRISKALNWALLITTIYLIGRFLDDVHRIADAERNNGSFYLCVEVLSLRLEEEFWKLFAFGFCGAFVECERVDDALGELSQRVFRGVKPFVQVRCTRVFLVVLQQAF